METYLRDLSATLGTDILRARELIARGVGPITLRPVGTQLVAELGGNLAGLLGYVDAVFPMIVPGGGFCDYLNGRER